MDPYTFILPVITQASLTRKRVGKLSVPSTIMSKSEKISSAFWLVSLVLKVFTFTNGLMAAIFSLADSSLGLPTSLVKWMTCRCRLVKSTTSKSTSPMVPTPAAERYSASGDPNPPVPMQSTRAAFSFCWPSMPTSGMIRCRE